MVVANTTLPVIACRLMCMWGPLVPIRERLVREMEDQAYSKESITVEIIINIVFVLLSAVFAICFGRENPDVSVRVWVIVYVVRYLIHLILVWFEYHRVTRRRELELQRANPNAAAGFFRNSALVSFAYSCDFFNMSLPFFWLKVGHEDNLFWQNALSLSWWYALFISVMISVFPVDVTPTRLQVLDTTRFTRPYLLYDVMFAMILLAGITACCYLPCFIIILRNRGWIVAEQQEDALEEDLKGLPIYRFHLSRNLEKPSAGAGVIVPEDTSNGDQGAEHVILPEDSECCICLCSYDDGIELHVLPCNHHFHAECIEKWLKIKATCPICNHSILKKSVEG